MKRIVSESSTTWVGGRGGEPVSRKFQHTIAFNARRGYSLESWQYAQSRDGYRVTDNIIAVFVLTPKRKGK